MRLRSLNFPKVTLRSSSTVRNFEFGSTCLDSTVISHSLTDITQIHFNANFKDS
jgi:hypothetical protein